MYEKILTNLDQNSQDSESIRFFGGVFKRSIFVMVVMDNM